MLNIANFNPDPEAPPSLDFVNPSEWASGNRQSLTMSSNWANRLLENELDPRCLRPYVRKDGRSYISQLVRERNGEVKMVKNNSGKWVAQERPVLTNDSNATLRFLDWIQLDNAIIAAAKPQLKATNDLRSAGLVYQLPNGIAKTTLQFQQQSDISGAVMSMDGLRQSESDRPVFSLLNFPLPIIHKDFQYPLRQILASRTGFSPLDTTTASLAGRRVAEQIEQLVLGCGQNSNFGAAGQLLGQSSFTHAGNTIQGIMNYSNRITYSITQPTAAGWTPQATIDDVLQMKLLSQQAFHRGPWKLYFGIGWDRYMDNDYKPTYNGETLRQRLLKIDNIQSASTVDYIPDLSLLLVQQSEDVIRLVIGMDITTVQWESHGGMQMNFKVMAMILPQIRTDYYLNTGLVHGS